MRNMVLFNTSPIQYLYQLGLFDVLKALYDKIRLPEEVVQEILKGKTEGVELPDIEKFSFVEVLDSKVSTFSRLVRDLGKGETAVIVHGLENPEAMVVLDDLLARRVAMELGLKLTGTAGILIAAKAMGLVSDVGTHLGQLERLGFYISPVHKALILKKASEIKNS
jgi:predicted nucleic acid-binding protein